MLEMITTTVRTNNSDKQDLFPPIPSGKKRVVVNILPGNPTESLETYSGYLLFGYNEASDDLGIYFIAEGIQQLQTPLNYTSAQALSMVNIGQMCGNVGLNGQVLGVRFVDTSIDALLDITIIYFDK